MSEENDIFASYSIKNVIKIKKRSLLTPLPGTVFLEMPSVPCFRENGLKEKGN